MSNKIVLFVELITSLYEPGIYQNVIEEVMTGIKPEFEEYGVGDDVFTQLREKWLAKLLDSRVADFESAQQPPAQPPQQHQQQHPYPAHTILMPGPHYYTTPPGPGQVKSEPADPRFGLAQPAQMQYSMPPLPGPSLNGVGRYGSQTSVLSFAHTGAPPPPTMASNASAAGPGVPLGRQYIPNVAGSSSPSPAKASPAANGTNGGRIPQVDGPSDDSDDSPSPPSFAPRSSHPSLPQPQSQAASSSGAGDEAINSDLDDSDEGDDDEVEEGTVQDADIVFCTYDKVARVKNKWKCILKDGMIHVNNKDYLFSKCTGEFEW
ncbi:transcription factor IIA subunit alpha [Marasmius crinis-equi]|uniref:Transcription factor IIA subunit alpha n=1 Tax=Marasmius crinis-equi TaxID=585013 RepID=A0ABR3FLE8_9AGAR